MNKKILIAIISLVVVIGGAVAYLVLQPKPSSPQNNPQQTEQSPSAAPAPAPQKPTEPGKYANYDAVAVADNPGRKVLFFHAAWCPQCRNLEKTILEGQIPSGMTIFKVNYDTATDLRQKYGVTLQTTLVEVNDQGEAIKKHVAYDEPTLEAVLKALGP